MGSIRGGDVEYLENLCKLMLRLDARAPTVAELTGVPLHRVRKIAKEIGATLRGGQLPAGREWFTKYGSAQHMWCSAFYVMFTQTKAMHVSPPEAMLFAYSRLRDHFSEGANTSIDRAFHLLRLIDNGQITPRTCAACCAVYVVERLEMLNDRDHCPFCRAASKQSHHRHRTTILGSGLSAFSTPS